MYSIFGCSHYKIMNNTYHSCKSLSLIKQESRRAINYGILRILMESQCLFLLSYLNHLITQIIKIEI